MNKGLTAGALAVGTITLTYVLTQWYVYLFPSYDASTFAVGALLPLFVSLLLPLLTRNRVLLYVFLAYFWALVEDGPVYLDSLYTWPEVTRFHPAEPHIILEVVYHVLTALFLVLAVLQVRKGAKLSAFRSAGCVVLVGAAFVLAYAQNIPLGFIQDTVETQWFQLDVVEHVLSALATLAALLLAKPRSLKASSP